MFEIRRPGGRSEQFAAIASDLVRQQVDVIVAANPNAVLSAKRATANIPIVMMHTPDPVELGLVASLARPGGNVTGVTTLSAAPSIKRLELLKEAVPKVSRVAILWNPANPWHPATVKTLRASGASLRLRFAIWTFAAPTSSTLHSAP